jgi:uncharacterized membrane protein
MTEAEINEREWMNPGNWSDEVVGLYFSKRDSRTWVPKRNPRMGWTLNLAHPGGAWWLVGLLVAPALIAAFLARRR